VSYCLNPEQPIAKEVIRIAREQIELALRDIGESDRDIHEAVHEVRRHCKLIRGLIRLVRPAFPEFRSENMWFRDLSRTLSQTRDATASIECLDALTKRFKDLIQPGVFQPVRHSLEQRRREIVGSLRLEERLNEARHSLYAAHWRAGDWSLDADGYAAIGGGLGKTYNRARHRMQEARISSTPELLHEWRKRCKYHRYHMKLLAPTWQTMIGPREKECHRLTDYLGDDHDLVVLEGILLSEPERFGDPQLYRSLSGLIRWRRAELQAAALPLGLRLFAETRKAHVERFQGIWEASTSETAEARGSTARTRTSKQPVLRHLSAI